MTRKGGQATVATETRGIRSSGVTGMGRRKGEDTPAAKKRRMPFVAQIRREDPFRPGDEKEVAAACRRVAAAAEFMSLAGWREDAGYRVIYFTTWAKARAMQHWIDRSGISHRPTPKLGLTAEELAERRREALAWGLNAGDAGVLREVVRVYCQARRAGDSELTATNAAADLVHALGRPKERANETVMVLLAWASRHHPEWF